MQAEEIKIVNVYLCFLDCLPFTSGRYHRCGVPGSPESVHFVWARTLFAQHVHWCYRSDHEFSVFWSLWSGRRRYSRFNTYWASSAKSMVKPTSGPVIKSHTWPKKERACYAKRKMSNLLLSQDYHQVLAQVHPKRRFRKTHIKHLFESTKSTEWWRGIGKPTWSHTKTTKQYRNWDNQQAAGNRLRDLLECLEFTDNLEDAELAASANYFSWIQIQNLQEKWHQANTVSLLTSHKDRNCEVCKRTKITSAPCRKRTGEAPPRARRFGRLITADHKFLNEDWQPRNNQRNSVVDPHLSPHLSTQFLAFALGSFTFYTRMSPIHWHSARRFMLWPTVWTINPSHRLWAHVSHWNQQRTHSDWSTFEKSSLDTNLDDLATTVDASDVHDTTEMGQLTSPLFSQELEVSANPFCVSCSQTLSIVEKSRLDVDPFSSVEKSRLGVEPFSTFEKRLSKGKRNRDLESEQDSQMEKERILSEQRYSWLPWKDNWSFFHGDFAAQSRLSEVQSDLDRRDWKMRHADVALCETWIQLQPGGRNLYQAHQVSDQTQKKKGLAMWRIRNEKQSFPGSSRKAMAKKSKNNEEFAVQNLINLDNWNMTSSPRKWKRILLQWIRLWFIFKNWKTKRTSSLNNLTFLINPWVFRVLEEW